MMYFKNSPLFGFVIGCYATFLASSILHADVEEQHISNRENTLYASYAITPADYKLKVVHYPEGTLTTEVSKTVDCRGIVATGGFTEYNLRIFDDDGNVPHGVDEIESAVPIGLVIINGANISKHSGRKTGGIVSSSGGRMSLIRASEKVPKDADFALQSHPILLFDGKVDKPLTNFDKSDRVAIGQLVDGRKFMITLGTKDREKTKGVTLLEFANLIVRLLPDDVDWALNLDGGPSVFLKTPSGFYTRDAGILSTVLCLEP